MIAPADQLQDLKAMSLEDLANLEVSIIGKRPSKLFSRTLLGNKLNAEGYGLELALDWRLRDWWHIQLA